MLKSIYIVTLVVLSLARSEQAYETNLGYETVARGELSAELAGAWQAPEAAGAPWRLMKPRSDSDVFIRFVEAGSRGNYQPMKTLGWNAVEIQAQDPDRLAGELDPEAFEIIGPPAFLTDKQNIRAMQVLGPDQELLYLTHVLDPAQSTFNIGTAQSYVDRVFIMVLGTADLAATTVFYNDQLGQSLSGPWPYRVSVLSRAWGLPQETMYDLSIAQLQEPFLVEISNDGGMTWRDKATLVDELDQIVFGGAVTDRGTLVLATVRSFSSPPRSLFVYHVDPALPGSWFCAPPLFVDGFEDGGSGRWSASHP